MGAVDWWNTAAGGQVFVAAGAGDQPSSAPSGDPSTDNPSGAVPLHFQAAAPPSHGFFDPARGEIFVNVDLGARPLAVTIAHELGHAFGLVHVTDRASVMTAGNLDVQPNVGDVAALAKLWGACGPAADGPPG
ncbi:MAG TPA: matrixin family metalloprotease [Polyangia bacterium]|nr:matrixin family metalloprotease [Polyangia bacterium]